MTPAIIGDGSPIAHVPGQQKVDDIARYGHAWGHVILAVRRVGSHGLPVTKMKSRPQAYEDT